MKTAELRNQPDKAIALLETVIAEHGNTKAPSMELSVSICGNFWLARLAREQGDSTRALKAYETILESSTGNEGNEFQRILCRMYEAELHDEDLGEQEKALKKLDSIDVIPSAPSSNRNWKELNKFYNGWAQHGRKRIAEKDQSVVASDYTQTNPSPYGYYCHMSLVGIMLEPRVGFFDGKGKVFLEASLKRAILKSKSKTDRDMAKLTLGHLHAQSSEFERAEKHLSELFNDDTYLAPLGGMALGRCKKTQKKFDESDSIFEQVKNRYPSFNEAATKAMTRSSAQ